MGRSFPITKRIMVVITALLFVFVVKGYAQNSSIGIKSSSLGIGLEADRKFTDSLGARIGINYFTYNYHGTKDDIEYDFDINLKSSTLFLDWYPFQRGFRLSSGILYNGNTIDTDARSAETYKIGDSTFAGAQVGNLTGEVDFNDVSPYLGIGWDKYFGAKKRFGLLFGLGVVYQGTPDVELRADGPIANDANFQSELLKEQENLESELAALKVYPLIGVGVNVQF